MLQLPCGGGGAGAVRAGERHRSPDRGGGLMTSADAAQAAAPGFAVAGVRLRGVVSALPRRRLENEAFVERLGADAVADVVKMIGVQARYWVEDGQTASDLCFAAAERLLAALDWDRASVDALIF